jgi:hypothetical protein
MNSISGWKPRDSRIDVYLTSFRIDLDKIFIFLDLREIDLAAWPQNPGSKQLVCKIFQTKELAVAPELPR